MDSQPDDETAADEVIPKVGAGEDSPVGNAGQETAHHWLTPGVLGVGCASLFSDASHELVTSLIPSFSSSVLHSGPAALGIIEGTSDALTGIAKLAGGQLASDPRRRARLASGGYLGTAIATAAIGVTTAVWQFGALRAVAWASRGIRSPARDTLLTTLAHRDTFGRAFGVERAGDNAGAIIGPLLAAGLVQLVGIRTSIFLSIIPGVLAAVAIIVAAREARSAVQESVERHPMRLRLVELRAAGLLRTLAPIGAFELGNVATSLLILRATDLLRGAAMTATSATSLAILLYVGHNVAATVTSLSAGFAADRFGIRKVFRLGAAVYVLGYGVFAIGPSSWLLLLLGFVLCGIGIGAVETAESTAVARVLPDRLRANGFGLLGLVQAGGDLGSTMVVGVLWALMSPAVGFGYAAVWMLMAGGLSRMLHTRGERAAV